MTGSIKVMGCWELGWLAPFTEHDLWHYPLEEFVVDEWLMMPVTGIAKPKVTEVVDLAAGFARNPDHTVVWLDEAGTTALSDFEHPSKALYVLGKASFSPLRAFGQENDISVRIETPTNGGRLWPHQAITMVLYDRLRKSWPSP